MCVATSLSASMCRQTLVAEAPAWGDHIDLPGMQEAAALDCTIAVHLQTPAGLATCDVPLLELHRQQARAPRASSCMQSSCFGKAFLHDGI